MRAIRLVAVDCFCVRCYKRLHENDLRFSDARIETRLDAGVKAHLSIVEMRPQWPAVHYSKYKITSALIREFVGASKLAQHSVYAVHCTKYTELTFRAFSPVALVYLTSGEVSRSAKVLAQNAGVILLASDEMYCLFTDHWHRQAIPVPATRNAFSARLTKEAEGFQVAR